MNNADRLGISNLGGREKRAIAENNALLFLCP